MKVLLNNDNIIQHIGNYDYIIEENGTNVIDNGKVFLTIPDLTTSNAYCLTLPENIELPKDIATSNKYKYENESFVKNPLYADPYTGDIEALNMLDSLTSQIPLSSDEEAVQKKVDGIVEQWKRIIKNDNVKNVHPLIKEGLFLLEEDDKILTAEQLEAKRFAQNTILKLKTRYRIESEVGDIYDQLADIEKKFNMFSGMIARMYMLVTDNQAFPEQLKAQYDAFVTQWLGIVEAGQFKDTSDVHDPSDLVPKIISRDIAKATLVEEYLQNKL